MVVIALQIKENSQIICWSNFKHFQTWQSCKQPYKSIIYCLSCYLVQSHLETTQNKSLFWATPGKSCGIYCCPCPSTNIYFTQWGQIFSCALPTISLLIFLTLARVLCLFFLTSNDSHHITIYPHQKKQVLIWRAHLENTQLTSS